MPNQQPPHAAPALHEPRQDHRIATRPDLHPAQAAAEQRSLILKVVRAVFAILICTFSAVAIVQAADSKGIHAGTALGLPSSTWVIAGTTLLIVATVIAIDKLTRYQKISTIAGAMLGALAGLLATLALMALMDLLLQSWMPESGVYEKFKPLVLSIKIIVGISLTYLGVITVLQTQDDFRLVIPYVEFSKQMRGIRPVLIDTSVLIDGRITDIALTNFLQAPVVIPRFVLGELQTLADSSDSFKRSKGRRGLDVVTKLQRTGTIDVTIDETQVAQAGVDQMLVSLAKNMTAPIMTTDVGLARVAAIQGVQVLNLNELANATKIALTPGEVMSLKVLRAGEQAGQGVGYLPDGTMIVVEDGANAIGQSVGVTVTSSLQTSAGRLIFARIGESRTEPHSHGGEPAREPQHDDRPEHSEHHEHDPDLHPGDLPKTQVPLRGPRPSARPGSFRNPRR